MALKSARKSVLSALTISTIYHLLEKAKHHFKKNYQKLIWKKTGSGTPVC